MLGSAPLWLIATPLIGALVVYLIGRVRPATAQWIALVALGLPAAAWLSLILPQSIVLPDLILGDQSLRVDGLSLLVDLIALGLGMLVVVFSSSDVRRDGQGAYYALLLLEIGAVIGLASATDLFNLWLWFETMAITSYVLVAFFQTDSASLEAAIKYLVQSAAGSTLALLGIALVLAQTGTLDLNASATASPVLLAAGALLIVGFGTKAGLVPFHMWLADAYSRAPSGISALFSGIVTKLALIAALRAIAVLAGVSADWSAVIMGCGVLAIGVGNALAFRQAELKRLLAWSSLAHVGYALLGIGVGIYALTPASAEGGAFQLLTHAIMSGAAFLAAGALLYCLRGEARNSAVLRVADLTGAARRYPGAALALSLALLGLAGLPPLAGFMSEWQIFVAGFETRSPLIAALMIFAAINVAASLAYYVPVVLVLYGRRASSAVWHGVAMPATMTLPLGVLTAASLLLGIWPALASAIVAPAAAVIVRSFGG